MDFGIVLQPDPEMISQIVPFAQKAEQAGFHYLWTFDSHILWPETYVLYPQILAATDTIIVGPMVTNPATRDPSVIGSMHATLALTYGNRSICGMGRGDSAVRVTGGKPTTLAQLEQAVTVIKSLGNSSSYNDLHLPWSIDAKLDVWVAAYGPKALALVGKIADGYILQLADPTIAEWMISTVRTAAKKAGRDPDSIAFCIAAPMYIGDNKEHMYQQCRWFGAMVGNHIADIITRYGDTTTIPQTLTDYVTQRTQYDYHYHGKADNPNATYVPDEIIERFCIIGTPKEHIAKLEQLRDIGVTQFAGYLQHDNKLETLEAYGSQIIPVFTGANPT